MKVKLVKIENPLAYNLILGQAHFIKTIEDIYETLASSSPMLKFGVAFAEASGPKLIRYAGNDDELIELARNNLYNLGAGHSFIIFLKEGFPINVLNALKMVAEVCTIFAATANPLEVVITVSKQGSGILGVIDGASPVNFEGKEDIEARKRFLRNIGYKL